MQMNDPARQGEALILDFYRAIDEARFHDAANCFAKSGEWHRKGAVLVGPTQVAAAYDGRDPALRTCHILSNLRLSPQQGGLGFNLWITFYQGRVDDGATPEIGGASMILTSHGLLVRSGSVWKFARKHTLRQFAIRSSTE